MNWDLHRASIRTMQLGDMETKGGGSAVKAETTRGTR
eukprot:CAMPEP_0182576530 /NCGR_PEP_ID=MMETSP1324-20130603/34236_1 /TAXON_ID=236786 /ORGANISM="Florenciella sp., Strain RCC1587" /LENGTH=36 /DNA_ID= /DNA_START= /DNA_END= /DNA_ORIENTATION=